MNPFVHTMMLTYLLYPILGLLLIATSIIIAKKNKLLGNKKLIGYFLITICILVIPSLLGFLDYDFMPYVYILLLFLYGFLGYYNISLIPWALTKECNYTFGIVLTSLLMFISMMFFTLVFNVCNELQYGLWASTCILPFAFISVFKKTYNLFIEIPQPIEMIWVYGEEHEIDESYHIDTTKLQLLQIELYKTEMDVSPMRVSGKAPKDVTFGMWFKRFLRDYNIKNTHHIDSYASTEYGGWMFYVKPSFFSFRRSVNFQLTIDKLKIKETDVVVAKRVKQFIDK